MSWVNAVVHGVFLGGYYALLATGLSLMFGVMRIINLAHGSLALIAAYAAVALVGHVGISPWLALLPLLPGGALLGYLLQRTLLERSLRAGVLVPLLTTLGLLIIIGPVLQDVFSADQQSLDPGALNTKGWSVVSSVRISAFEGLTLGVAVLVLGFLHAYLRRTQPGRELRATAQDPETAELLGVDSRAVYARATAIAVATVALAGVFFGLRTSFGPFAGGTQLIYAFETVVIGGLGSLWGTLWGGIALGIAQDIGFRVNGQYGPLFGHALFLVVLVGRTLAQRGGLRALLGTAA